MIIRRAVATFPTDISEILEIQENLKTNYTRSELEVLMRDDRTQLFVAQHSGNILGYALGFPKSKNEEPKTFYIKHVAVRPEVQNSEIGSALFLSLLSEAAKTGHTVAEGHAYPAAVPFYQKHGVIAIKSVSNHFPDGSEAVYCQISLEGHVLNALEERLQLLRQKLGF